MKNTIKLFGIIALAALIGFTMVACPEPDDGGGNNTTPTPTSTDITWELDQEGGVAGEDGGVATATTTAIKITFSAAVELTDSDITISGAASRNENDLKATGGNTVWTVPVTVEHTDFASVTINKTGVKNEKNEVMVYLIGEAPAITWTATVDGDSGTETSTAITFTFSADVEELDVDDIELTDGTGSATATDLTADTDSKVWKLSIEVTTPGTITITINKTGISTKSQEVTVHKKGVVTPVTITWEAVADGSTDVETSTQITFTFSADVEELELENIIITNGTGSIEEINSEENLMISLNPSYEDNTEWTLSGITVLTQGNIKIKIEKEGIDDGEQTIAVYKAIPDVTYTVTTNGTSSTDSSKLTFTFSEAVTGLELSDITIYKRTGDVVLDTTLGSTNGGTIWDLDITAKRQGAIVVKITKEGVSATGQIVKVFKSGTLVNPVSGVITWLYDTNAYSGLQIEFSESTNGNGTYELTNLYGTNAGEGEWTWDDTTQTVTLTATSAADWSGNLMEKTEYATAKEEEIRDEIEGLIAYSVENEEMDEDDAIEFYLSYYNEQLGTNYTTVEEYVNGETAKAVDAVFAPRPYTYIYSTDETMILLEALPESNGTDPFAGKTFYGLTFDWNTNEATKDETQKFEFSNNGTYTATFNFTNYTGSYSYDTDTNSVYLTTATIDDQTPADYYDAAMAFEYSNYPTAADDRTVQTNQAFTVMKFSYSTEDDNIINTLGGSGIGGLKATKGSARQRSR
jgi:hypothetical protein